MGGAYGKAVKRNTQSVRYFTQWRQTDTALENIDEVAWTGILDEAKTSAKNGNV